MNPRCAHFEPRNGELWYCNRKVARNPWGVWKYLCWFHSKREVNNA